MLVPPCRDDIPTRVCGVALTTASVPRPQQTDRTVSADMHGAPIHLDLTKSKLYADAQRP